MEVLLLSSFPFYFASFELNILQYIQFLNFLTRRCCSSLARTLLPGAATRKEPWNMNEFCRILDCGPKLRTQPEPEPGTKILENANILTRSSIICWGVCTMPEAVRLVKKTLHESTIKVQTGT